VSGNQSYGVNANASRTMRLDKELSVFNPTTFRSACTDAGAASACTDAREATIENSATLIHIVFMADRLSVDGRRETAREKETQRERENQRERERENQRARERVPLFSMKPNF
jgi:hypothetical protein